MQKKCVRTIHVKFLLEIFSFVKNNSDNVYQLAGAIWQPQCSAFVIAYRSDKIEFHFISMMQNAKCKVNIYSINVGMFSSDLLPFENSLCFPWFWSEFDLILTESYLLKYFLSTMTISIIFWLAAHVLSSPKNNLTQCFRKTHTHVNKSPFKIIFCHKSYFIVSFLVVLF